MALTPGTRLGVYEVTGLIGEGGMGQVYRARDTKLNRDVALKVLPDSFVDDPDRLARFTREAQTLASLNHPNIAHIHGLEESGGVRALVMEIVEGDDLSQRIAKGAVPLDEALPIAKQIAEALEAAHEQGIIHRDLKPANIKVRPDGTVKVLDFGLAKAMDPVSSSGANAMNSPTLSMHATEAGIILGTAAYMSPEQARGKGVDRRADIWAFGCVLFEMVTGKRAFEGETLSDTMASVLKSEPPWDLVSVNVPAVVRRLLRRCLEKDPKRRLQAIGEARFQLQESLDGHSDDPPSAVATPVPAAARGHAWLFAGAAFATAVIVVVGWIFAASRSTHDAAAPVMTFTRLTMQPGVALDPSLSPDGKWVLYVSGAAGNQDIYLQSTSGQSTINLTKDSPANDTTPAFSADGDSIVFRSERDGGGLFVMGRTGDSVRRLTSRGFNPTWFPDGRQVVFATETGAVVETRTSVSELWVVSATGGEPRRLFAGDAVQPRVSPHGRRIAFWGLATDDERRQLLGSNRDVWTIAADGSAPVRVTDHESYDWNPVWSPDGRWLYFLSNRSGSMNLWRIAIDEASGATNGQPQQLSVPAPYIRQFSLSADGRTGTYATFAVTSNVARLRFDPRSATVQGAIEPITSGPRDFTSLAVSPDGRQLVVQTSGRQQEDLYLMAADGSGLRQLTNDAAKDRVPRWSPDGRHILFYSERGGTYEVWTIDRDGSGLRPLTKSQGRLYPMPSRDGSRLAAVDNAWQIYLYDPRDWTKTPEMLPPFPEEFRRGLFSLYDWSPDGRLLAGGAGGEPFVYSLDTRTYRRVGVGAGNFLNWLPDGRRLLFARQGRLSVTDWVSGEAHEVFAIAGETVNNPSLSPDGTYVYFEHGSASGDIWMVRFDEARR